MKLIPVDPANEEHLRVLYDLLTERPAAANISHKKMPTWKQHQEFVAHCDYFDWCLIQEDHGLRSYTWLGAVYLTRANEIGISVFNYVQNHGHGPNAVVMMMMKHGERNYYANVAPNNEASRKMFAKLGFKLIQVTYALELK